MADDVAVFDPKVRATLPAELADQAKAVYEAIELASDFRAEEANARVSHIPRSSPYSQWRLLIRGLVAWHGGQNLAEAKPSWDRLDRRRRPGRIAAALMASHRTDLEAAVPRERAVPVAAGDQEVPEQLDDALLRAALLVRKVRVERPSIRRAEMGTSRREPRNDMLLGPEKIDWLLKFCAEFEQTDGGLVAALRKAALKQAFAQPYVDLFQKATRLILGPPHDPHNLLLSYFYRLRFENGEDDANRHLRTYLDTDLPQNQHISPKLRDALISRCYLNRAVANISLSLRDSFESFLEVWSERSSNRGGEAKIASDLKHSIEAYPSNSEAHQVQISWLKSLMDHDRTTATKRQSLKKKLVEAMTAWSASVPDAVEPRLWLLDHLLENEQLSEAKPHIEWLRMARHEDPRVRSAPWKWQLLEASRLCRRKAWLVDASAALDAAEATWPAWLPQDWLPYLRAALLLRTGATSEFERMRDAICQSRGIPKDNLTDACMMLGAAQRMRVSPAELAPLRQPVEDAKKNPKRIDIDDLVAAGSFFWDLHRTSLLYPAYRNHGSKFARELTDRLRQRLEITSERLDNARFQSAVLWLSEHRFSSANYEVRYPKPLSTARALGVPKIVAARLNANLRTTYGWGMRELANETEFLREAAQIEGDPYYRFWFASLAEQALAEVAKTNSFSGMGASFARAFEAMANHLDDELDGDSDNDPACHCPACTAARRAARR